MALQTLLSGKRNLNKKETFVMAIQSLVSRISRFSALSVSLLIGASALMAQGYYDDDIYYDASKAKKETKKAAKAKNNESRYETQPASQYYYDGAAYVPWNNVGDYQAADSYSADGSSTRDVDEYNRRTSSAASQQVDSISLQQFEEMSNTHNLARFHGSKVAQDAYVENTGGYDDGYQQPVSNVTINLVGSYPYYNSWNSPWYWNSWGYYDPFWGWGWSGPSWSWGWGPSWAWGPSWGWGPSWSWGPPWGWGPSWGCGPAWGVPSRPHYTSSGAFAPNRPRTSSGSYRNNSYRNGAYGSNRGSIANSRGRRPSANGAVNSSNMNGAASSTRPGYRQPIGRPNTSGTVGNGSSSGAQRGRGGYINRQSGVNQNTNTQRYNSNSSNRSNNHYNSNSYNSSRGRSGSIGGSSSGSRGGGFSGGGSSRGSGGGHRGR